MLTLHAHLSFPLFRLLDRFSCPLSSCFHLASYFLFFFFFFLPFIHFSFSACSPSFHVVLLQVIRGLQSHLLSLSHPFPSFPSHPHVDRTRWFIFISFPSPQSPFFSFYGFTIPPQSCTSPSTFLWPAPHSFLISNFLIDLLPTLFPNTRAFNLHVRTTYGHGYEADTTPGTDLLSNLRPR